MQRFSTWDLAHSGDFWYTRFNPKDFLKVAVHSNSVLSQRKDARLIERYDINQLHTHTTGTCYIWIPITLDPPTYDETQADYKWCYDVDPKWLFIDAIYDKHIDPEINLQHNIDFSYKEKSGKLYCKKKILNSEGALPKLYISKGWYSEYRTYNEIGHLLNYLDTDSQFYRDSIDPILAALFVCPTQTNILAMVNVMIGLPVAKFGDEVVTSIKNGIVTTDKYNYVIGDIHTSLQVDDILYKYQPITDVVEFNTYFGYDKKTNRRTTNKWWTGKPADYFQQYLPGQLMSNDLRNYLMESYLYQFVSGIDIRQDRLGNYNIILNRDVENIFKQAIGNQSDFIFVQSYHIGVSYDPYGVLELEQDIPKVRLCPYSVFGESDDDIGEDAQFWYSSKKHAPLPKINNLTLFNDETSLSFNEGRWNLYEEDAYQGIKQFWRYRDPTTEELKILVEPWKDFVYLRCSETPLFKDSEVKYVSGLMNTVVSTVDSSTGRTSNKGEGFYSSMSVLEYTDGGKLDKSDVDTPLQVESNTEYSALDIQNLKKEVHWTLYNTALVSIDNRNYITVQTDSTTPFGLLHKAYADSPAFAIGLMPKTVIPKLKYVITKPGSAINLEYSQYLCKTLVPSAKGRVATYAALSKLTSVANNDLYIVTETNSVYKASIYKETEGSYVVTKVTWTPLYYINNPMLESELANLDEYTIINDKVYYWDLWTSTELEEEIPNITNKIKFRIKLYENANILDGKPYFSIFQIKVKD